MAKRAPIHPGEILKTEFLDEFGLTAYALAKALNVPTNVQEGQPAEVKLEAFPFTRYGIITGEVESISHDAVEKEKLALVFPALVKLSRSHIEIGDERIELAPGFAATAEIRTVDRRIIEFLLSPLSRRLQEAGRER